MGSGLGRSLSSGWGRASGLFRGGFGGARSNYSNLLSSRYGQRMSTWSSNLNRQMGITGAGPQNAHPYGAFLLSQTALPLISGPIARGVML